MDLVVADANDVKPTRCSIPSRKVRIIGKIRGLTPRESESLGQDSKPWITVKNPEENGPSEKCKVNFESQPTRLSNSSINKRETSTSTSNLRKDGFELDYCYQQHEEIHQIYSREIQPLVWQLFEGRNASVIALGAKGSGKTSSIQGSQEKPGLAVLAMHDILAKAKELGKSVSVSMYKLTKEHVKDLLNPENLTIQVLETAHGEVIIKGLSKVHVNSMMKFHNTYFGQASSENTHKVAIDQSHHKGLMVHIWSDDNKVKVKLENKINFVDLAGYEDLRKSSKEGTTLAESNMKNRSLYALLKVVSALNSNEKRVPYRESKLTRVLQDSLGGSSNVLLLTCLNPYYCQDSISSISLVSRSCRSVKQVLTDSTNRTQSSAKVKVSSFESGEKTMPASLSSKKETGHSRFLSTAKNSLNGRKLFVKVKNVNSMESTTQPDPENFNIMQLRCQSEDTSCHKSKNIPSIALVVAPFSLEEIPQDKSTSDCSSFVEQIEDVNSKLEKNTLVPSDITDDPTILMKMESKSNELEGTFGVVSDATFENQSEAASTCEENKYIYKKGDGSPPLSERIREICNNLKSLCESTPSTIKRPEETATPCNNQVSYNDFVEPKTPAVEPKSARYCTPRGTFSNCSSKIKNSFVQEYLNFLNSANKEELKSLKGIGEKRATYIMEMREESPEPFKDLDDLQDIGLSAKQIKGMMKQVAGGLFEELM